MISDKVRPHHLERKALLYVRQSSAHQVLHNRESSALQYAMQGRLTALGWSEIEVIDDDLGRSAAGGVRRAGFERMVAEMCLGKVGAVCAREVSRFARNSRNWQQLIEMCRVVDTVLIDQETSPSWRAKARRRPLGWPDPMPPLWAQNSRSDTGTRHSIPRYSCNRGWMDIGERRCIAFGGLRVDDAIEDALLGVVGPGAIAAAIAAEWQADQRREQVREVLKRDLEAARYAADRAFRQYDAADPANRLVAGELEARWNRALAHVAEVESKIAAHDAARPGSAVDPASLVTLATNLKAVWAAPTTDARLKKRIVRTLIHEVVADIDPEAAEIVLIVHWIGGVHSEMRLPRRRREQRNSTSADIIAAVRHLVLIANDDLIAGILNRNGLVTGHGNRWTRERVTSLRSHHRILVFKPAEDRIEPWLNLSDAARLLKIAPKTLRLAAEAGEINARMDNKLGALVPAISFPAHGLVPSRLPRGPCGNRRRHIDCRDRNDG